MNCKLQFLVFFFKFQKVINLTPQCGVTLIIPVNWF